MAAVYQENPHNFSEINAFVITEAGLIKQKVFAAKKCFFYDTCSLRQHANLKKKEYSYLLEYIRQQEGLVVITRCILMELASHSGILNIEYIDYIKAIHHAGIEVIILNEEDLYEIMSVCYSANAKINGLLMWAVRMMKSPTSTITETLKQNEQLNRELLQGKNLENGTIYQCFFSAVRKNKESSDNLGEELLGICLHILSHLPGEEDGKFCMITDDKGAAGKVDTLFRQTNKQYRGKKIIIYSTPKLVQVMYHEKILYEPTDMQKILRRGSQSKIKVLGELIYDLQNREITLSSEELSELIREPNGIHIVF